MVYTPCRNSPKRGLRHGGIDIRTFLLADPSDGEIIPLLLTYVDDILIAHRREGLKKFMDTIGGYKTGGWGNSNVGSTLQLPGLYSVRVSGSEIQLYKCSLISRLKVVGPNEYV